MAVTDAMPSLMWNLQQPGAAEYLNSLPTCTMNKSTKEKNAEHPRLRMNGDDYVVKVEQLRMELCDGARWRFEFTTQQDLFDFLLAYKSIIAPSHAAPVPEWLQPSTEAPVDD